MPAGDLITQPWQLELRATLMGAGTDVVIDRERGAVGGLFDIEAKQAETEYAHAPGSFSGDSFEAARTVTVALALDGFAALSTMRATWAPSSADLELWFQLPDIGKGYVVGRPIGLVVDSETAAFGLLSALASFRITDPTIHT
jgi:hypothetical protein